MLHAQDVNGWQPIHEAVRGGSLDVVKYLLSMGADFSSKTSNGGTPLYWAKKYLPEGHVIISYLHQLGAPDGEVGDEEMN